MVIVLASTPKPHTCRVHLNGIEQAEGLDYEVSGQVLHALGRMQARLGDSLDIRYETGRGFAHEAREVIA